MQCEPHVSFFVFVLDILSLFSLFFSARPAPLPLSSLRKQALQRRSALTSVGGDGERAGERGRRRAHAAGRR